MFYWRLTSLTGTDMSVTKVYVSKPIELTLIVIFRSLLSSCSGQLLPGQPLLQGLACSLWVLGGLPEPEQPVRDTMHMCVHA